MKKLVKSLKSFEIWTKQSSNMDIQNYRFKNLKNLGSFGNDITFIVQHGVRINCNKLLAVSDSTFLRTLFGFRDSQKKKDRWRNEVSLDGSENVGIDFITEESIQCFVDFVEKRSVPDLSDKDVTDYLATANFLGAFKLLNSLEDQICQNIDNEDLIEFINAAKNWQFSGLHKKLITKMASDFYETIEEKEIRNDLIQLGRDDFLNLMDTLAPEMNVTRLSLYQMMNEFKLSNGVKEDEYANAKLKAIADKVSSKHFVLVEGHSYQHGHIIPDQCYDYFDNRWRVMPVVSNDQKTIRKTYVKRALTTREITPPAPMHTLQIIHGDKIFWFGQIDYKCEVFNTSTQKYDPMPPMLHRRRNFSAVLVNDEILVAGGEDQYGNALKRCEFFSIKKWQWRHASPLILSRISPYMKLLTKEEYDEYSQNIQN